MQIPSQLQLYCKVLFIGHLNVTREFLPLIEGRKHLNASMSSANGGRIVNISSCSIYTPSTIWMLYGALKSAMAYWSHGLRYELAPRFGIHVCSVEPGGFATNIWDVKNRLARLQKQIDESVWNAYKMDAMMKFLDENTENVKKRMNSDLSPVVDAIVHALMSQHPLPSYRPGWDWKVKLINAVSMDSANYLLTLGLPL